MKKSGFQAVSVVFLFTIYACVTLFLSGGCRQRTPQVSPSPTATVAVTPAVLTLEDGDLPESEEEILNLRDYSLSEEEKDFLMKNGFLITPSNTREMYESYSGKHPYITIDSVLHTYRILHADSLRRIENRILEDEVRTFSEIMLVLSEKFRWWTSDKETRFLRDRAISSYIIPCKFMGRDLRYPSHLRKNVEAEIDLIKKAEGTSVSPVYGIERDYSVFKVPVEWNSRKGYYRAMIWYSLMPLRISDDQELRSAIYITNLYKTDREARDTWRNLDQLLTFLIGPQEEITPDDIARAMDKHVKGNLDTALKPEGLEKIRKELMQTPTLRVSVMSYEFGPKTTAPSESNLRFFGKRYPVSSFAVQDVINNQKRLPDGLDIAVSLWRSATALEIMSQKGFGQLPERADVLRESLLRIPDLQVPKDEDEDELLVHTLQHGIALALNELYKTPGGALPGFMKTKKWKDRILNSSLAGWAEMVHRPTIYPKDARTYDESNKETDSKDFSGYVEPYPRFYEHLAELVEQHRREFNRSKVFKRIYTFPLPRIVRDRLVEEAVRDNDVKKMSSVEDGIYATEERFERFEKLLRSLSSISRKELLREPLTEKDRQVLAQYGREIKWLSLNESDRLKAPDVTGIITDPIVPEDFGVFQAATGNPQRILVLVKAKKNFIIASGSIYSYYEPGESKKKPVTARDWKKMIQEGSTPKIKSWSRNGEATPDSLVNE